MTLIPLPTNEDLNGLLVFEQLLEDIDPFSHQPVLVAISPVLIMSLSPSTSRPRMRIPSRARRASTGTTLVRSGPDQSA